MLGLILNHSVVIRAMVHTLDSAKCQGNNEAQPNNGEGARHLKEFESRRVTSSQNANGVRGSNQVCSTFTRPVALGFVKVSRRHQNLFCPDQQTHSLVWTELRAGGLS